MAVKTIQVCDGCGKPSKLTGRKPLIADAFRVVTSNGGTLETCSYKCIRKASVLAEKGLIEVSQTKPEVVQVLFGGSLEESTEEPEGSEPTEETTEEIPEEPSGDTSEGVDGPVHTLTKAERKRLAKANKS